MRGVTSPGVLDYKILPKRTSKLLPKGSDTSVMQKVRASLRCMQSMNSVASQVPRPSNAPRLPATCTLAQAHAHKSRTPLHHHSNSRRFAQLSQSSSLSLNRAPPARPLNARASATPSDAAGTADDGYRLPPKDILDIVEAPVTPSLSLSPSRNQVLILHRADRNPPVAELARPELRLAGLRIDPQQNTRSRMSYYLALALADLPEDGPPGEERPFTGIPENSWLNYVSYSPDGKHIAFTVRSDGSEEPFGPPELWVASTETLEARPLLPGLRLNTTFEDYSWTDNGTLVACVIPAERGEAPQRPRTPPGPRIQSSTASASAAQTRTYQDLLKDKHDEELFEYYCTSHLVKVDLAGAVTELGGGEARLYCGAMPSPDGRFLLVEFLERPFSFQVPCGRFPKRVQVWSMEGEVVREVCALPLAEDIPIAHNSCRRGRRGVNWRNDVDHELYWVEAQDGGDPRVEADPRDVVFALDAAAPEEAAPRQVAATSLRYGGMSWCDGRLALLYESWYKTRRSVVTRIVPDDPAAEPAVVFDRYYEDVYNDPGSPMSRRLPNGEYVLATLDGGSKLLLLGGGARPDADGKRPFVDVYDLRTQEKERLWESCPPFLEYPVALMDPPSAEGDIQLAGLKLLISRESPSEPPQYYTLTWPDPHDSAPPSEVRITDFPHPYPGLKDLQKEILQYERADGTPLTATLYTPPGYDKEEHGPLPTLLWAYPREFKTKEAAGQLRDSPYRFSGIGPSSPLLFLARGYAVLDGPTIPIIGEGDAEPNDTYVEQLTASAEAAVAEVVQRGVAAAGRIGIGGHSYGAFMTANLLAHAPHLFACGIARSGAYNRTLTPFGFQAEERTLWEATDTYIKMSPYLLADKVSRPILLIHGEDDNNTGTFPMQSERYFSALKGHGVECRLVILPHESHGYRGKESVLHTLAEMSDWLDAFTGAPEGVSEEAPAAPGSD